MKYESVLTIYRSNSQTKVLIITFDGHGIDTITQFITQGLLKLLCSVYWINAKDIGDTTLLPSTTEIQGLFHGILLGCLNYNVQPNPPLSIFMASLNLSRPGEQDFSMIKACVFVQGKKKQGGATNVAENLITSLRNLAFDVMPSIKWYYTFGFVHEGGGSDITSHILKNAFRFGRDFGFETQIKKFNRESQYFLDLLDLKNRVDVNNMEDKVLLSIYEEMMSKEEVILDNRIQSLEEMMKNICLKLDSLSLGLEELKLRIGEDRTVEPKISDIPPTDETNEPVSFEDDPFICLKSIKLSGSKRVKNVLFAICLIKLFFGEKCLYWLF